MALLSGKDINSGRNPPIPQTSMSPFPKGEVLQLRLQLQLQEVKHSCWRTCLSNSTTRHLSPDCSLDAAAPWDI